MCRGQQVCSELGDDPAAWSKTAPLQIPRWFDEELEVFADAIRSAASGDLESARTRLRTMRGDELREWYVEHGQNSGGFRYSHLGKPEAVRISESDDPKDTPSAQMKRDVFSRDGYRCRYCGLRVFPKSVMDALRDAVGRDVFVASGVPNNEVHGAGMVFWAVSDHVDPHSLGGRTDPANLVCSCPSCNYGKAGFTIQQIGLNDPRDVAVIDSAWDGLTSKLPDLLRVAG